MRIVTGWFALLAQAALAVEPAVMTTLEDGNAGVLLATPDANLPLPAQALSGLPPGAAPHGVAFLGGEVLLQDFALPKLYRTSLATPGAVTELALPGRSNGTGTLAAEPNGRFALSVGESSQGAGEAVVVDFGAIPPTVTPIVPTMRVRGFVTAAIDFGPDRRAYVCHTTGVSVLKPPYTTVEFTMAFPAVVQSPSMCRLSPDGSRLFVTRVLSETVATVNGVRTTAAPFSAQSVFTTMPAPNGVQGLGPMAVSPDGQALLVGQQFLFPGDIGTRARAFVLRAPFGGATAYEEITLPASLVGMNCTAEGNARDCPGFEHIESSADGTLAILTGNSSSVVANVSDRVPAVFVRNPFVAATRDAVAVQVATAAVTPGRGSGAVRFQPSRLFRDGLETP
jgi:hypothetical protein